jgi:hypothetical protein
MAAPAHALPATPPDPEATTPARTAWPWFVAAAGVAAAALALWWRR